MDGREACPDNKGGLDVTHFQTLNSNLMAVRTSCHAVYLSSACASLEVAAIIFCLKQYPYT